MWVQVPGAARDFSCSHLPVQTLLWCPAVQLSGHTEILHTLIGMGSTALVAAVPYPGKASWISCMGQGSIKKQNKTKNLTSFRLLLISIIAPNTSSVCYASRPQFCVPDSAWCYNGKRGRDSSMVRMPDWSRVRIPAGAVGEFSSPWSNFCADFYFSIIQPPCYHSST